MATATDNIGVWSGETKQQIQHYLNQNPMVFFVENGAEGESGQRRRDSGHNVRHG